MRLPKFMPMSDEAMKRIWEDLRLTGPLAGDYSKDDPSDAWAQSIEEGVKLGAAALQKKQAKEPEEEMNLVPET